MTIDIIKAQNGWILNQSYPNRAEERRFVFKTLEELAMWIIAENECRE